MSDYLYPEQQVAEDLLRFGNPVIAGMVVGVSVGFAEHAAGLGREMGEHRTLSEEIGGLENQNTKLKIAEKTLEGVGATVTGVEGVVNTNQQQIVELQTKKDELGSEVVANIEFFGLPFILGGTLAVMGIKRAIAKGRIARN